MTYETLFHLATGFAAPRPWQAELAANDACSNRLINIPTGFGKTEGVALAWFWNRVARAADTWPRRLVWCLPMRVLVEQTVDRIEAILRRLSAEDGSRWNTIAVHQLMGGVESGEWHLEPERSAVLVGTQDMLLSRALNRGYASGRARWPIDFGLLNHDCLWVMDEVQLMDIGLVTSVQLQAYRQIASVELRPCRTWWMSATLQASWLNTPESTSWLPALERDMVQVRPAGRADAVWQITKRLEVERIPFSDDRKHTLLAERIWREHRSSPAPAVTLVVVNRVESAVQLTRALEGLTISDPRATRVDVAHSRFRGRERAAWRNTFLSRTATEHPSADRIIVATQVIEAGADITCDLMVTELAPWTNLVQRFGRVARYGGTGRVIVVDRHVIGKDALPYREEDLGAARMALASMSDVGVDALCRFEEALPAAERETLYWYAPLHVLTPREHDELFDTTPDLTGADLDISRFIRSGDERDVTVAWVRADDHVTPDPDVQPGRDDLCPLAVSRARAWLFKGGRLRDGCRAWAWDYLDGQWRRLEGRDLYPGQVILVAATWGGYDVGVGFTGEAAQTSGRVPQPLAPSLLPPQDRADRGDSRDDLSEGAAWKTIATHGREVGAEAARLISDIGLNPSLVALAELAGRVHDWGKAHPAFRASIRTEPALDNIPDVAKAPTKAWLPSGQLYPEAAGESVRRRGLRHEFASMLAILELLGRSNPMHPAIIGRYVGTGWVEDRSPDPTVSANTLAREFSALSPEEFDLLLYVVCAHHGKVRAALHVTPDDQDYPLEWREPERGLPLRGVRQGDIVPAVRLYASDGTLCEVPPIMLRLDIAAVGLSHRYGPSWTERALGLRAHYGPCALAFLEALFRAADVRASRATTPDPLVPKVVLA